MFTKIERLERNHAEKDDLVQQMLAHICEIEKENAELLHAQAAETRLQDNDGAYEHNRDYDYDDDIFRIEKHQQQQQTVERSNLDTVRRHLMRVTTD